METVGQAAMYALESRSVARDGRGSVRSNQDGKPLVLATGIPASEEVLLLLNHASENKLARAELRSQAANQKSPTVNAAVVRLIKSKEVRPLDGDEIALTLKGQIRIMKEIIPKWNPYR